MNFEKIAHRLMQGITAISYGSAPEVFKKIYSPLAPAFLFESKDISPIYGRLSLIGIEPVLRIRGKDTGFTLEVLQPRGEHFLAKIVPILRKISTNFHVQPGLVRGTIEPERMVQEESMRSQQKNIAQVIRLLLQEFAQAQHSFLGLYGALSYDFVRLFEELPNLLPQNDVPDFDFFLYDTFILFDHLKKSSELIVFRSNKKNAEAALQKLHTRVSSSVPTQKSEYAIRNPRFTLSEKEYCRLVQRAKREAKKGEIFEVVFSNILKADFSGDAFALYKRYRDANPSPYLFFFDFGEAQLVGASPEMMVRVEDGMVHMRPISGTAARGADPISDHENMLALLKNSKERSELDMLIDLGRNDLSRICEPGVHISDYRFVEKYSRVMHTVAHLSGKLRPGYKAFDALISCVNAGTLTGAPKVAAMQLIESCEKERRGFYGGTIGYLTFSGTMDSGIIIRTAHITENTLRFQVGATLLHRSVPKLEYAETVNKARAFLDVLNAGNA